MSICQRNHWGRPCPVKTGGKIKRKPELTKDDAEEFVEAIILDLNRDGEIERAEQIRKDWEKFLKHFS